jgi:hypothetical protein
MPETEAILRSLLLGTANMESFHEGLSNGVSIVVLTAKAKLHVCAQANPRSLQHYHATHSPVCDGTLLSRKSSSHIPHIANLVLRQRHVAYCKEATDPCSASSAAANEHLGTRASLADRMQGYCSLLQAI